MSDKLQDNVSVNVTRLLTMLKPQVSKDSEEFKFVQETLTRMAILGTLPPGCGTAGRGVGQAAPPAQTDF
jgi:hypothetical protein